MPVPCTFAPSTQRLRRPDASREAAPAMNRRASHGGLFAARPGPRPAGRLGQQRMDADLIAAGINAHADEQRNWRRKSRPISYLRSMTNFFAGLAQKQLILGSSLVYWIETGAPSTSQRVDAGCFLSTTHGASVALEARVAEQFEPVRMLLAGQEFARTFSLALRAVATWKRAVVEVELEQL
jgi:hypothetical protein